MSDAGGVTLIIMLFVYFIPYAIAHSRKHRSASAILLVNVLLGWTLIGWLWALIWSLTGNVVQRAAPGSEIPTPETHVKCPDCAELVRAEARVCKHCGCKLVPQQLAG